ncbi:hypothetical protein EV193_103477 [Herbihabitans rhizosphaerae]|uniref:DUF445 domain-containing protein n=1 Tax=Herbihabitans rhizosphaerae TaxID=1872711 RepID=A0A4Q7KWU6_9PSEU|nr:DUF445 domain-containing protein [Herbihabitans rhizosphaerae]RZS41157.1 hypothetical protein EV193_103477 [Herbihabitans rhizosphaerae]
MSFQSIVDDVAANWHVYATMPVIAALIGYITKRAAIEMMFRPIDFVGIKGTFIGWQGVIPRNSHRMASIAMDLMTTNLIRPKEIFSRLDPKRVTDELREPLREAVDEITREIMSMYQPTVWEMMPEPAQRMLVRRVQSQAPRIVETLIAEVAENIDDVLDVRDMAVTNLVRDKAVLNRLIRDISRPEMRFIARSGIYFGTVIGLVQVVAWAITHSPWIMPIFGGLTGWLTDWLALKMIFLPRQPKRFAGLVTWQGMFQKRKEEVAVDYGNLIADEILTLQKVLEAVLTGPKSDRLFVMIEREVRRAIDAQLSVAKPLVVVSIGSRRYQEMKQLATRKAIERIPEAVRRVEGYATEAMDVRNTIIDQIKGLTPLQYEGLLRPAFRQDEWKLIAVGAIIGFLVGELQVLLVLPH